MCGEQGATPRLRVSVWCECRRILYFLNGKTNLNHHPSIASYRELLLNPFEETVLKAWKLRISSQFLRVFFFRRPKDNCYGSPTPHVNFYTNDNDRLFIILEVFFPSAYFHASGTLLYTRAQQQQQLQQAAAAQTYEQTGWRSR